MKLIARVTLRAGGVRHPPGSVVEIDSEREAASLIERDFARPAPESEPEPEPVAIPGTLGEVATLVSDGAGTPAPDIVDISPDFIEADATERVAEPGQTLPEITGTRQTKSKRLK